MEDEGIIELFFNRDEKAITETDKKYGKLCYSIACQVLNQAENAKECVNDTYLETWNCIPPHRPSVFSAFISKITRRIAISRWRKENAAKRGGGEFCLTLDELAECLPDRNNTAKTVEDQLITRVLNDFLHELPVTERNVFLRRYWYAAPVREIAVQFGFSESKVKSMLMRTRNRLKKKLSEEELI